MAIQALLFDVFGTLTDWRSSIAREAKAILAPLGHAPDWLAFADAWRGEYQPAIEEIRSRPAPLVQLDVVHRKTPERILRGFGIAGLPDETARNLNLAWHRLDAWTDVKPGMVRLKTRYRLAPCSNGNISIMVDIARRNGMPWDAILGAEIAGDFKPKPRVYLASAAPLDLAPTECMIGPAPSDDLKAAA